MLIKCVYGEDIRRFQFNIDRFEELRNQISSLYRLERNSFKISYFDEQGNKFYLNSDESLRIAEFGVTRQNPSQSQKVLRLLIEDEDKIPNFNEQSDMMNLLYSYVNTDTFPKYHPVVPKPSAPSYAPFTSTNPFQPYVLDPSTPQEWKNPITIVESTEAPPINLMNTVTSEASTNTFSPSLHSMSTNTQPAEGISKETNTQPAESISKETNTPHVNTANTFTNTNEVKHANTFTNTNEIKMKDEATITNKNQEYVYDDSHFDAIWSNPQFQQRATKIFAHAVSSQAFQMMLLPQFADILAASKRALDAPIVENPIEQNQSNLVPESKKQSDSITPKEVPQEIQGKVEEVEDFKYNPDFVFIDRTPDDEYLNSPVKTNSPLIHSFLSFFKQKTPEKREEDDDVDIPYLEEKLEQLSIMGFSNRELNIKVIKFHGKYKEGLDEVIEDLLTQSV